MAATGTPIRIEMLSKVIGSEPLKAGESGRLVLDLPHLDQQRRGR